MSEITPLSISINEALKALPISRSQLYVLIGNGTLAARKCGHRTLVDYPTFKAYHDSLPAFVPGVPIPNAPKKGRRHG